MKVIFRKVHAAAVLGNEWMSMAQLPPRLVELQPGPACHPHCWDPFMVQSGREFLETGYASSALREDVINGDVKNAGGLTQASLRT